jgi:YHS domain-containing protein
VVRSPSSSPLDAERTSRSPRSSPPRGPTASQAGDPGGRAGRVGLCAADGDRIDTPTGKQVTKSPPPTTRYSLARLTRTSSASHRAGVQQDAPTRIRSGHRALRKPPSQAMAPNRRAVEAIRRLSGCGAVRGSGRGLELADGVVIDPVCGMKVRLGPHAITIQHEGTTIGFCATGCRDVYAEDHDLPIPARTHDAEALSGLMTPGVAAGPQQRQSRARVCPPPADPSSSRPSSSRMTRRAMSGAGRASRVRD